MLRSYGLGIPDYARILKEQDYKCKLCGVHEDAVNSRGNIYRKLNVDHDHATGKVRGLLCHNCNVLLGHAKDSAETLQAAIDYLRKN